MGVFMMEASACIQLASDLLTLSTFHGNVSGTTLSGTADMTSRSAILGSATETASLSLQKQ